MSRGATQYGCRQAEAFCLMLYRDTAGNEEWIWNSRDAVTPFGVRSRQGLEATHVDWQRDRFSPFHEPKLGDRIFMNMTMDSARELATTSVEKWWDHETMPMRSHYESKEVAVATLARSNYDSFGAGITPTLVEVTEDVLNIVRSHRAPLSIPEYRPRRFA